MTSKTIVACAILLLLTSIAAGAGIAVHRSAMVRAGQVGEPGIAGFSILAMNCSIESGV
jgi:hypothetical protein